MTTIHACPKCGQGFIVPQDMINHTIKCHATPKKEK